MFAVIEFVRGNDIRECALVPTLWLTANNTLCYWPRMKNEGKFNNLVKSNAAYETSWPTFAVHRVLHTIDDYDSAAEYMASVLENGTSEDGVTNHQVTLRPILSNNEMSDQTDDIAESKITKKHKRKTHKRDKRSKKNKRAKYAKSTSSDNTEDGSHVVSSNEENEQPNLRPVMRSVTGLEQAFSTPVKKNYPSIDTIGHGNTSSPHSTRNDMRVATPRIDMNSTPHSTRNDMRVATPRIDMNSTPNSTQRSFMRINETVQSPCSSVSIPGASRISFETKIMRYLELISGTVDQTQIMISQILRINQALSQVQSCAAPQGFPDFPITSLEVFEEFNEMLEDEAHRTYLVQKLASVGGLSQRQAVMNMLKVVMSNSLAMKFNWAGREKKCFKSTKFMKILNEAAKVAFRGKSDSSDVNIASAVKDWLKLATSRHMYAVTGRKTTPK